MIRFVQKATWRENHRRDPNGAQVDRVAMLAMPSKPSIDFAGYWQRYIVEEQVELLLAPPARQRLRFFLVLIWFPEQFSDFATEGVGDLIQYIDARIDSAAFKATDVAAINVGIDGQCLLGEARRDAQTS